MAGDELQQKLQQKLQQLSMVIRKSELHLIKV